MPETSVSVKLYRLLLKLYPAAFHQDYGAAMEREFRDELAESRGAHRMPVLWFRLLRDLAMSIPVQLASELRQDATHTLRLWAKSPWLTGFAILALAIGIGANTGVFSVVNAVVLRSLPFRDPGHLVSIHTYHVPHGSAKQFHDWRTQSTYLADAALFEQTDANLGDSDTMERAHISQTSWNFFSVLGAHTIVGRTFRDGEDNAGQNAIAVLGYGLWKQLFAGDRSVLGHELAVNGHRLTIIGVMPPGFDYPGHTVLWKAAEFSPGNNGWETVARLKPGITLPLARTAFFADMARLAGFGKLSKKYPPQMIFLKVQLVGPVRNGSLLLMGGVLLILLIACSNVANLLLARTADRTAELSIRSALGATRARLAQQLLTECLLLSLAGCARHGGGALNNFPRGQSSAGSARRRVIFHSRRSRIGVRSAGDVSERSILWLVAIAQCRTPPLVRRPWLQRRAAFPNDSRDVHRCAGDHHDYSFSGGGFRGTRIRQTNAHRSRLQREGIDHGQRCAGWNNAPTSRPAAPLF